MNTTNCKNCHIKLNDRNSMLDRFFRLNSALCRECYNERYRQKLADSRADPEFISRERNNQFKYKYGITLEQYNKMLELQLGGCAICKSKPKENDKYLVIDHNHDTNQVRGLLCNSCNLTIGYMKENELIIWNLLDYLKKHEWAKAS